MDKKEISIRKLAISSGCSESTIKKYRQENYDSYSIEVVLAIAAGLKCYPFHTYNLLSLAGYTIETSSKKNQIYKYLVTERYKDGIHKWNDYLAANGIPKLNDA